MALGMRADAENGMNKVVIPTGYMGSGSSAVTDLVSEFEGYRVPLKDFEFIFLHCPNGVFDLEDKLLIGNNAIRSDEALRTFRSAMKELYENPLWWPGRYKWKLGHEFMDIVDAYVDELTQFESDSFWYHQEKRRWRDLPAVGFTEVFHRVTGIRSWPKKPLMYQGMKLSVPTGDEFYAASRRFIENVLDMMGYKESSLILDQLLLPFNAWRIDGYFKEGVAHCFIVDRDPRDVYLSNKYIWAQDAVPVPYPFEVHEFCAYYKRVRQSEHSAESPHVQRMHFEDLVYDYDTAVGHILDVLGLDRSKHASPLSAFDPARSLKNTQLFRTGTHHDEIAVIEEELEDYLYQFPYELKGNTEGVF